MPDINILESQALSFVLGNAQDVLKMPGLRPLPPFSEPVINFLNDLSLMLRATTLADVATFAFWCRGNALLQAKKRYEGTRLGRGIAFHSAPSNVPLNFAFSWVASLLAGNATIMRLPRISFEQESIICNAIRILLPKYGELASYNVMLRYSSDTGLNDYFSALCDVRVIWGGDGSIRGMRRSPLKPGASEIVFPDRYSILVIQADKYMLDDNKEAIARSFYNDTYLLDQNACSSPALIVWTGVKKEEAKEIFWAKAREHVSSSYELQPIQMSKKLEAFCSLAASGIPCRLVDRRDWQITRIMVERIDRDLMAKRCHSGFFFEYNAKDLDEINQVCGSSCQTVVYYGYSRDELGDFILRARPDGICRFVPMGRALEFSLIWDGVDLIEALSRQIEIW